MAEEQESLSVPYFGELLDIGCTAVLKSLLSGFEMFQIGEAIFSSLSQATKEIYVFCFAFAFLIPRLNPIVFAVTYISKKKKSYLDLCNNFFQSTQIATVRTTSLL